VRCLPLAALPLAALGLVSGAQALRLPSAPACPIFPPDNPWNRRVDHLPVLAKSAALVAAIGADEDVDTRFGPSPADGIPINVIRGAATPKYHARFEYAVQSDRGPYPIPPNVAIESGDDGHAIIVARDSCRLYELYGLRREGPGWRAGSGAIWNLRSNRLRPRGWTSADAAGLPILPGLARWDEVARGRIDHALRITVPRTRNAFVYPARHHASGSSDPKLPAMGQRFRLRAGFDASGFPPQARVFVAAMKRYGVIVADHGSPWSLNGIPNPHWDNNDHNALDRIKGSDFEAVDARSLHP
jgi:hypothetical protein